MLIKKWRFSNEGEALSFFYGIEILDETGACFRPTYPFSDKIEQLQSFIVMYEKDLLDFYVAGCNYSFARFIYGIDTDMKDKFRDRWFEKGVVFY